MLIIFAQNGKRLVLLWPKPELISKIKVFYPPSSIFIYCIFVFVFLMFQIINHILILDKDNARKYKILF